MEIFDNKNEIIDNLQNQQLNFDIRYYSFNKLKIMYNNGIIEKEIIFKIIDILNKDNLINSHMEKMENELYNQDEVFLNINIK